MYRSPPVQFGNQSRRRARRAARVREADVAVVDVSEHVLNRFQLPGKPGHGFAPLRREKFRHVTRLAARDPEEVHLVRGERRREA